MMYLIAEETLNKIVEFARQNPDYDFHTEIISDGGLSCIFLDKNDNNEIWELDEED